MAFSSFLSWLLPQSINRDKQETPKVHNYSPLMYSFVLLILDLSIGGSSPEPTMSRDLFCRSSCCHLIGHCLTPAYPSKSGICSNRLTLEEGSKAHFLGRSMRPTTMLPRTSSRRSNATVGRLTENLIGNYALIQQSEAPPQPP